MKRFTPALISAAVITAIGSLPANAQTAESTGSSVIALDTVDALGSLNKLGTASAYQAKSAVTLSQDALQDQAIVKMDTIAKYQAGMTNQVYGSDTNTNWFRIRGADASQSFDGAPAIQYGFFTPHVNSFGLEAVEISKGADSLAYGSSNAGGLINYRSKKPDRDKAGQGEVQVHAGGRSQRGIAADYTGAFDNAQNLRYRIVADYHRADGDWKQTYNETYYLAPSFSWDITDRTSLTVLASVQKDVGTPSSNFLPQDGTLKKTDKGYISRRSNLGDPTQDHESNTAFTAGYEFSHDFGQGLTFSQNYRYQHVKNQHQGSYVYPSGYSPTYQPLPLSAANDELARGVVYNDGTAKSHSIDNRLSWDFHNDQIENTLLGGIDYRRLNLDADYGAYGSQSSINVFTPSAAYGTPVTISAPKTSIRFRQTGVYLQDSFTLNKQLNLTAGVRRDFVKSQEEGGQSISTQHTSYNASAMYYSPIGLNPYIAYSNTFRQPTGISGNNTLYKPNITKQTEIGVKYAPDWANFDASLALFRAKDEGAVVYNGSGIAVSSPDPIERKGAELQVQGNFTDNISGQFAYTYLDAKTKAASGDTRTAGIPRHTAAVRGAYTFTQGPAAGLSLGAGVRYAGGAVTSTGSLYSGQKIPSYTTADFFGSYAINKNMSAQLNIDNAFNRRYLASCDYYCYYGQERRVYASFTYKW